MGLGHKQESEASQAYCPSSMCCPDAPRLYVLHHVLSLTSCAISSTDQGLVVHAVIPGGPRHHHFISAVPPEAPLSQFR